LPLTLSLTLEKFYPFASFVGGTSVLEQVGFVAQHWHQVMLTAREAQLMLDGREERHRHLSFFRRVHAKRDSHVFIDHEVVMCAEKLRA
jgi:hypothetical protein